MLKKIILLIAGIFLIFLISLTSSYTAPTYNDINFTLCSGYTAPTYNDINFTLATSDSCISDTCTYSGSGNWNVDCADNCSIDSNVDLGNNNLTLTGTGHFDINAIISNFDKIVKYNECTINIFSGGGIN